MSSGVHDVQRKLNFSALFGAVIVGLAGPAYATVTPAAGPGACGGDTIGAVICNVIQSSQDTPGLLTGLSYLFGLVIGIWAIAKFYAHVNNPNQTPVWEALQRVLVAGCLFALPIVLEATYETFVAENPEDLVVGGWEGTPTGGGLDAMVVALMSDSWKATGILIVSFCYLAGIVFAIVGIMRLMKSAQEGPRGPGGFGTIMTFLIAGTLFSVEHLWAVWSTSLFGTADVAVAAELNFDAGLEDIEREHILSVISAVLAFVMILGWISFVRGLFIVRDVAEGNSQASLMAGMTHLFGGALAINLGPVLNAVQTTFGLADIGVNFG